MGIDELSPRAISQKDLNGDKTNQERRKKMRFKSVILALAIFLFGTAGPVFSLDSKVRVTASKANIRLRPDTQSAVVMSVPLGAVLDVIKKEGDWYFVKLPPDEKSIVVTGYLHQITVEVVEEANPPAEPVQEQKPKEVAPVVQEKPVQSVSAKEKHFLETDPYYQTWRNNLEQARKERGGTKKWFWIGGGAMLVGYVAAPLLAVSSLSETSTGESQNSLATAGLFLGMAGTAVMTYGLISYLTKSRKISRIMEDGAIKGYILGLNINPQNKQYGIIIAYRF